MLVAYLPAVRQIAGKVLVQARGEFAIHKNRTTARAAVSLSGWLAVRTAANQEWALDFAHDAMAGGRGIRVLSVVDACTRECLALEVDNSSDGRRVESRAQ